MTDQDKTVRVTASLYRGLGWLKPTLTHRQWLRFTGYTKHFHLAAGYVY